MEVWGTISPRLSGMSGLAQPLIWYAKSGWYKMVVLQPLLTGEMLAGGNRCFSKFLQC